LKSIERSSKGVKGAIGLLGVPNLKKNNKKRSEEEVGM